MAPDVSCLTLGADEMLVLATDGYWAALDPDQQAQFLEGKPLPNLDDPDDCSA